MDHAVVAVASTEQAAAPFQKLGLKVSDPIRHEGIGSESRMIFVGERPDQSFYVEFLAIVDEAKARAAGRGLYLDAVARGGGLARLMLKMSGLPSPNGCEREESPPTSRRSASAAGSHRT